MGSNSLLGAVFNLQNNMYTVYTTKLYSTPYQFYVGLASKIKIGLRLLGANYCEVKMNTYPILFHPSPQKKSIQVTY